MVVHQGRLLSHGVIGALDFQFTEAELAEVEISFVSDNSRY
jgi:hypothetical protein